MICARQLGLHGRIAIPALDIADGSLIALVGPNGGGKTSLLRALAGIEGSAGQLEVDGVDRDAMTPAARTRALAFVPASRDMAWPVRVQDFLALGLPSPDPAFLADLLATVELTDRAATPADRLSTGERARLLLARGLAARPRLLLLDEPLANLDPYWVLKGLALLDRARGGGTAIVAALHDLHLLHRFDRALLVAGGEVQMDEAPADLVADERFLETFRLSPGQAGSWAIRPQADPRSSP